MDRCFQYQSSVNLLEMLSFPFSPMQFHSSSFCDNHNCDLRVGTELQQEAALGDVLPGQEMGKRFLLGKQAQTQ